MLDDEFWQKHIDFAHEFVQQRRKELGLPPWEFRKMPEEYCTPCKEAGFPGILAHYRSVPAAMTHDGKPVPAQCIDHRQGRVPRWVREHQQKQAQNQQERGVPVTVPVEVVRPQPLEQVIRNHDMQEQKKGRLTSPKWYTILKSLADLPNGKGEEILLPEGTSPNVFRGRVAKNDITRRYRFSIHVIGEGKVRVTKLGMWEGYLNQGESVNGKSADSKPATGGSIPLSPATEPDRNRRNSLRMSDIDRTVGKVYPGDERKETSAIIEEIDRRIKKLQALKEMLEDDEIVDLVKQCLTC